MDAADPQAIPTVTVRGDGLVRTEPDEAVLWITLTALEESPGPALADVSARTTALIALLDELGVRDADRSTTGIAVGEEFDHTPEGRVSLGHRASSGVSVRQTDPELIGRLIARSTQELDARIGGPRWLISLDNPVRLDAARLAAADARRKAEAYAEGVGARVGRLIGLSEPGEHAGSAFRHARAVGLSFSGGHDSVPIEPGEHEIAASVQATFALELG